MNECELNYVAGYFDGEGSVTIVHSGPTQYGARVTIVNSYKPALERLQKEFGGRISKHTRTSLMRKQVWALQIGSKAARDFLVAILPYLQEKAPQAREVIEFYDLYHSRFGSKNRRTAEEKADQQARYLRVKALKTVGYAA